MKLNVRSSAVQAFGWQLTWKNLKRAEYAVIEPFLLAQRGQFGIFTFIPPIHSVPLGSWAGAPLVNGASQSGRTLAVDGFSPSQTVAKAGDFFKLAANKVYKLTADAISDVSGNATLTFEPALMTSPANNEALVYNNVPFTVCLMSDNLESPLSPPSLYDIVIDLVESL